MSHIMEENMKPTMEKNEKDTMENQISQVSLANKPEVNFRGWKAMPFIIGNETFEKLGAIGTLSNLLVYLTTVFNMKSIIAANIINIFNGTANFGTLIGAFLCDTYFGRYNTLGFCTAASFLGLIVIQLTAAIPKLHPPHCQANGTCTGPSARQMTFLLSGFALMIIGAGGIRPCNLAFGADQFNPETESGKKGIASFFNWYVFTYTFSMMISLTLIVYVQSNVSWSIGLGIPAILMLLALVLFFAGTKLYVRVPATGSPMTSITQVVVAAIRKRKLKHPEQPREKLHNYIHPNSINSKLPYTEQFRTLDKAAIRSPEDKIKADGSAGNPWRLCSIQQVEEVKCVVRVLPIWAAAIVYHVVIVQQQTYVTFQAFQFDRRLGHVNFKIPAASYYVFQMLSLSIFVPLYDRILVPFLRRVTGKDGGITILQRIGIGILLSIISMLVSAIVEERRRTIAHIKPTIGLVPHRGAISSMSGLWLIPQLVLAGVSEGFAAVGQLEFYYKQFPENMRSIGGSLFYCGLAGSSYLSSLLITIVHSTSSKASTGNWLPEDLNKGRLDYFYYMITALGVFNLGYFLVCAKWYKYKETDASEVELQGKQAENGTA